MTVFLENADKALQRARREHAENAYGPFWDAVNDASERLGRFNTNSIGLQTLSRDFSDLQEEFPDAATSLPGRLFPISMVPNPRFTLEEYLAVVRIGLTNFEFAMIFEQRKTQPTDIRGFESFGDVVSNLPARVEAAVLELTGRDRMGS